MKSIDDTLRALHAARNDPSEASYVIQGLVASGEDVVRLLVSALGSGDSEVRSGAAKALGSISVFSEGRCDVTPALPLLVKAMADYAPWVAFHASKTLWLVRKGNPVRGLHPKRVVRCIAAVLESEDPQVRAAAANEFRLIGGHAKWIIRHLVACLGDPVLEVRFAATRTLCDFGAKAHEALPKFIEWIDNEIPEEVFVASVAVIQMDDSYRETLMPGLLESFGRLGDVFRAKAVYLLLWLLAKEPRLVAMLVKCYHETCDREVRLAVVEVFAGNIFEVRETHPLLIEALLDEEPDIAQAAARGLNALGQDPDSEILEGHEKE